MKLLIVLGNVHMGSMPLPKFQRGYVWYRNQAGGLMQSVHPHTPI